MTFWSEFKERGGIYDCYGKGCSWAQELTFPQEAHVSSFPLELLVKRKPLWTTKRNRREKKSVIWAWSWQKLRVTERSFISKCLGCTCTCLPFGWGKMSNLDTRLMPFLWDELVQILYTILIEVWIKKYFFLHFDFWVIPFLETRALSDQHVKRRFFYRVYKWLFYRVPQQQPPWKPAKVTAKKLFQPLTSTWYSVGPGENSKITLLATVDNKWHHSAQKVNFSQSADHASQSASFAR